MSEALHLKKGQWAESQVLEYFLKRGYSLIKANLKTSLAQIDYIFRFENKFYVVEVKSLSLNFPLESRVCWKQKRRLRRARAALADFYQKKLQRNGFKDQLGKTDSIEVLLVFAFVVQNECGVSVDLIYDEGP